MHLQEVAELEASLIVRQRSAASGGPGVPPPGAGEGADPAAVLASCSCGTCAACTLRSYAAHPWNINNIPQVGIVAVFCCEITPPLPLPLLPAVGGGCHHALYCTYRAPLPQHWSELHTPTYTNASPCYHPFLSCASCCPRLVAACCALCVRMWGAAQSQDSWCLGCMSAHASAPLLGT
jgi:hypothetical protein